MSFKYGNLKHLPASWHQLEQLQELNIEGNPFFTLPACLTQIKCLKVDQKNKQLFMDIRYNSENPLAIDADLFNLNAYPNYKEQLKTAIQNRTDVPILAEFEDFILDCSTVALALIPMVCQ